MCQIYTSKTYTEFLSTIREKLMSKMTELFETPNTSYLNVLSNIYQEIRNEVLKDLDIKNAKEYALAEATVNYIVGKIFYQNDIIQVNESDTNKTSIKKTLFEFYQRRTKQTDESVINNDKLLNDEINRHIVDLSQKPILDEIEDYTKLGGIITRFIGVKSRNNISNLSIAYKNYIEVGENRTIDDFDFENDNINSKVISLYDVIVNDALPIMPNYDGNESNIYFGMINSLSVIDNNEYQIFTIEPEQSENGIKYAVRFDGHTRGYLFDTFITEFSRDIDSNLLITYQDKVELAELLNLPIDKVNDLIKEKYIDRINAIKQIVNEKGKVEIKSHRNKFNKGKVEAKFNENGERLSHSIDDLRNVKGIKISNKNVSGQEAYVDLRPFLKINKNDTNSIQRYINDFQENIANAGIILTPDKIETLFDVIEDELNILKLQNDTERIKVLQEQYDILKSKIRPNPSFAKAFIPYSFDKNANLSDFNNTRVGRVMINPNTFTFEDIFSTELKYSDGRTLGTAIDEGADASVRTFVKDILKDSTHFTDNLKRYVLKKYKFKLY